MPSKNVVKINVPGNYYHVCTCGASKQRIYMDEVDYQFFLSLFENHLSEDNLAEMLAYCLMSDCFDLLICQIGKGGVAKFMRSIVIAYNEYYYNRYQVKDLLSETDLKISKALSDNLLDISRHIHTNPSDWMDYPYSSIRAYLYDDVPSWLNKTHIVEKYGSAVEYLDFLKINQ